MVFLLSFLVGCGSSNQGKTEDQGKMTGVAIEQPEQENSSFPVNLVDSLGREVTIEKTPEKLISLSPGTTEILFALGMGDKVVGVTDYCTYPEEALSKAKIGGFQDPNVELIIEKDPDVIFMATGVQEEMVTRLESLGIKVIALDAQTLDEVLANIQLAAQAVGAEAEAAVLLEDLQRRVDNVTEKTQGLGQKPTVFFEVWDDPLMTAGPQTFIADLIRLAGGSNVADDTMPGYAQFSLEILLERDPDVYLIQDHAHEPEDVLARAGYQGLKAVKTGRVYAIKDDLVTLPGPRLVEGLEAMALALHPDLF